MGDQLKRMSIFTSFLQVSTSISLFGGTLSQDADKTHYFCFDSSMSGPHEHQDPAVVGTEAACDLDTSRNRSMR